MSIDNSSKIKVAKSFKATQEEIIVSSASSQIRSGRYENTQWPYYFSLPFMWILIIYVRFKKFIYRVFGLKGPKINTLFFDGLGKNSRKVKEYASSWKALDIVYNHPFPYKKSIGNMIDEFYWNSLNCQALRNRRKLIKEQLRNVILEKNKKEVKVISLACGSAEVLIEVIAELEGKVKIKALLIDIDKKAIERAKELVGRYNLKEQVEARIGSVYDIGELAKKFKPDVIEMMGFIDYIDQEKAIELACKIKEVLLKEGVFITCNIAPNIEDCFLTWVIDWPMIYRTPRQLAEVAIDADFNDYRIVYEPLRIHGILIAKK